MSNHHPILHAALGSLRLRRRAFTLVELLISIGIIAVLIAILLPVLANARAEARVAQCAARMRQIEQAIQMYVNENKGYLPPIMFSVGANVNAGGAPTIFPSGRECYLYPYIAPGGAYVAGKNYNQSSMPTSDLFCCPDFDSTGNFTSNYTYRYNWFLGGGAVGLNTMCRPWKMSQVTATADGALLAEGDAVSGSVGQSGMGLTTEPSKNANGLYGHNPRYGIYIHMARAVPNGSAGITNVGYCDGSVRSLAWSNDIFPKPPFDTNTWIDPAHVGQTGW